MLHIYLQADLDIIMQHTGFSGYIKQRLTNLQYDFTHLSPIQFLDSNGLLQIAKEGKKRRRQIDYLEWMEMDTFRIWQMEQQLEKHSCFKISFYLQKSICIYLHKCVTKQTTLSRNTTSKDIMAFLTVNRNSTSTSNTIANFIFNKEGHIRKHLNIHLKF